MSERELIDATATPCTVRSLRRDLERLGVAQGTILLCHSSLRSLGWVCGGEVAVVRALEEALGPQGTLVMPTHTTDLSEPSLWGNPPVPADWWPTIRADLPPFSPDLTPSREMGRIAECFRKQDGTQRSHHPQFSFAARGALARELTADHSLDMGLGEGSPLRRIYDRAGSVLLLGVGHESNTSLHLGEHRARHHGRPLQEQGAPLLLEGERRWVTFADLDLDSEDFVALGADFARETGLVQQGLVGRAQSLLMPQPPLVDYASGWFDAHRRGA